MTGARVAMWVTTMFAVGACSMQSSEREAEGPPPGPDAAVCERPDDDAGSETPTTQPDDDPLAVLRRLLPPPERMPPGCYIAPADPDRPLPEGIPANPTVSADARFVAALCGRQFKDAVEPSGVRAALFSVYSERLDSGELGLFAWYFATVDHAAAAWRELLRQARADTGRLVRMRVFASGLLVVLVWRDRGSNESFTAMCRFAEEVVQAVPPPATQPDEVRFFGVTDRAGKVVYVCDKSGSLATVFPYVQGELVRSINALDPAQRFQAVFFAGAAAPELLIEDKPGLHPASPRNKTAAKEWINKQVCYSQTGTTDARPALERAFKVQGGPPDVIFLLTDGMLPAETVRQVAQLNAGRRVRIHTILFRDRIPEAEQLLRAIARDSGGRFRFVDEDELGLGD